MNEQGELPKHVHMVPDEDLRMVEGVFVFDVNKEESYNDHAVDTPHAGENHGNIGYFKLKLLCRKKGTRISTFGHLNQFSEIGILSDTIVSQPDDNRLSRNSITNGHVVRKLLP